LKAINSKFVSDFVLDYNMNQCDLSYSLILNFNDIILTLQFNLFHFNLYLNLCYC
jgi:hypothetical protein